MIKIVVQVADATMAANIGSGPVHTFYKTFDISCKSLENYLSEYNKGYFTATVTGVEVIADQDNKRDLEIEARKDDIKDLKINAIKKELAETRHQLQIAIDILAH